MAILVLICVLAFMPETLPLSPPGTKVCSRVSSSPCRALWISPAYACGPAPARVHRDRCRQKQMPNPLSAFRFLRYGGVASVCLLAAWAYGCFYALVVMMPRVYAQVHTVVHVARTRSKRVCLCHEDVADNRGP